MVAAITIDAIMAEVSKHFDLTLGTLLSRQRHTAVVVPRMLAMYLARKLTGRSFPAIGKAFRGRDHTTVVNAVQRIEAMLHVRTGLEAAERAITEKLLAQTVETPAPVIETIHCGADMRSLDEIADELERMWRSEFELWRARGRVWAVAKLEDAHG